MTPDATNTLLDHDAAAWAANDPERIASLWDATEDAPIYKVEEVLHYFHKMEDIHSTVSTINAFMRPSGSKFPMSVCSR